MKIKTKQFKERNCCGDSFLYQLDGWGRDEWLCADCFLNELMREDYIILNKRVKKQMPVFDIEIEKGNGHEHLVRVSDLPKQIFDILEFKK